MKICFVCFFLWAWCISLYGQIDSVSVRLETIKQLTEDSLKLICADEIPFYLDKMEYGSYPSTSGVRFLGYKQCVNAEVELFSWAVPLEKGQAFYNWFRFKEKKSYLLSFIPDMDNNRDAWLFYDLLAFEVQNQLYFALLGWNKTRNTNRKVVQIVRFGTKGKITFNHAFLRKGNHRSASLMFEYAQDGSMMLKHDRKGKRIIFDHLAPVDQKYEGYTMFYGPDGSYDALIWKGGEWRYQENVKQ